jgi:cyclomaltodextrinase / maltogenic alpha-amylase / neopullulanase
MAIQTPDWVKHAVFYQIFPDRFARSSRIEHVPGLQFKPWGAPPEEQGFQGGDLLGIVDKLDYLQDLGITALYLNPIFSSASNHRYHTFDYMQVDPLLGGDRAFRELLDEAHARDMRVVIDGVFNHASRGFWAFHHILECGGDSPYVDWFIVNDWPLRPYQHDKDHPHNYAAWWDLPALPKFNVQNPGVREYLLEVSRYWIEFGADGWRLDVPDEIKDAEFWRSFRKVVKEANPEAYITGEIWRAAEAWLRGDMFDSVMNYIFSRAALSFFGAETVRTEYKPGGFQLQPLDAAHFSRTIDAMFNLYDWEIDLAQLNLLDSHDTGRVLWTVGEDESALRLCALFQMTMPGAPCIYYGSEIGMTGGDDPGCRGAFPWSEKQKWNHGLLDFYKRAIALRHAHPALRTGKYDCLYAEGEIYAFGRASEDEEMVVIFNAGKERASVELPLSRVTGLEGRFDAVWGKGDYAARGGKLSGVVVPGREATVLLKKREGS